MEDSFYKMNLFNWKNGVMEEWKYEKGSPIFPNIPIFSHSIFFIREY